jgi:hypothetical protein
MPDIPAFLLTLRSDTRISRAEISGFRPAGTANKDKP